MLDLIQDPVPQLASRLAQLVPVMVGAHLALGHLVDAIKIGETSAEL